MLDKTASTQTGPDLDKTVGTETGPEPGYAAAVEELDAILDEISSHDLDVDLLAARVERASTLIEICRKRITNARMQVERVMATLVEAPEA